MEVLRLLRKSVCALALALLMVTSIANPVLATGAAGTSTGVANGYVVVTNTYWVWYNATSCPAGHTGYSIYGVQSIWQRVGPQPSNTIVPVAYLNAHESGATCDGKFTNVTWPRTIYPSFGTGNYFGPYYSWSGWPYAIDQIVYGSETIGGAVTYEWEHTFDRDHRPYGWSCSKAVLFNFVNCPSHP